MKRMVCTFLALLLLSVSFIGNAELTARAEDRLSTISEMMKLDHIPGIIDLQFDLSVPVVEQKRIMNSLFETDSYFSIESCGFYSIDVGEESLPAYLESALQIEQIRYAFPDFEYYPDTVPGTGSSPLGYYDYNTTEWALEAMGINDGWEKGFKGSTSISIAVLDSGLSPHSDMGTIDWANARNVYVSPATTDVTDNFGHGTFIVGEIAALLDNSGINGICRNITIVPIKIVSDISGNTSFSKVQAGLNYAESLGIKVANISYNMGHSDYCGLDQNAFHGILVTSAGNHGMDIADDNDNSGKVNNNTNWIVVGSVNSSIQKATDSNFSATYVDIFAPGVSIMSFGISSTTVIQTKSGTSFAAPFIAGIAGIVISHCPNKTRLQIIQLILGNAEQYDSLIGYCLTSGIANLDNIADALYSETRPAYSNGDVDGTGSITSIDYILIKRYVLGTTTLTGNALLAADVNGDGTVNSQDYLLAKRFIMRTNYFPASWTPANWSV